jgi:DNA polymerase-3 subunit epsilon
MSDILFIDTETGGLKAELNPILQMAYIIESNGVIVKENVVDVKPADDDMLVLKALEVNGFTLERMKNGVERVRGMETLRTDIKTVVGGKKPLFICGHNIRFDIDMLHTLATKTNHNWWLNFGNNDYVRLSTPICTLNMCHILNSEGILDYPNYRLKTVCERLDIELDNAHDALADIKATREVYHALRELFKKIGR